MKKPVRVFWAPLSKRFFATNRYKYVDGVYIITGKKYDVTGDIARATLKHQITFELVTT